MGTAASTRLDPNIAWAKNCLPMASQEEQETIRKFESFLTEDHRSRMWTNARMESLYIPKLRTMQSRINPIHLLEVGKTDSVLQTVLVYRIKDQVILADGNHRVGALINLGILSVHAKVVELNVAQ